MTTLTPIKRLSALVDRLRPGSPGDAEAAEMNFRRELQRLTEYPEEAAMLGEDVRVLLALPHQSAFYAETGVRSALGFWLELMQRLGQRLLPHAPDLARLPDILRAIFRHPRDHEWVVAVSDATWVELAHALQISQADANRAAMQNVLEASRVLSYRLAGTALDRELLRADPAMERYESPFLAQNVALMPVLERARNGGAGPSPEEVADLDVMLDQCTEALDRVRRKAGENGISIRLTYLLARLRQLIERLHILIDLSVGEDKPVRAAHLLKTLLRAEQTKLRVASFVGQNVSLLARNITDHASRHGEHYIAESRKEWWAMARSAAGGGIIIAVMAILKIRLSLLHLPPLTEGILFGLNYGLGFVLIHLLGFTVATKQPAMTAAAIAATLEESRPRELERLSMLAQNVVRTQCVAVLGNIALALPVAALMTALWLAAFDTPLAPAEKLGALVEGMHPWRSAALFYAGIAGVGLFLSGLVAGYFDNQARYHRLASRAANAPILSWLGQARAARLGDYLDAHYGAILGNLFFGMYLGLAGSMGTLTGLPVDIRHVAFSSANLGAALTTLSASDMLAVLPWALLGLVGIALVNLAVSFSLALYVAEKSRRIGIGQAVGLGALMLRRFARNPLAFFRPPEDEQKQAE